MACESVERIHPSKKKNLSEEVTSSKRCLSEEQKRIYSRADNIYNTIIQKLPSLNEKDDSGKYLVEKIKLSISRDDYGHNYNEDIAVYQHLLLRLIKMPDFKKYYFWTTIENSQQFPYFKTYTPTPIGKSSPSGNFRYGKVMIVGIMLMSEAEKKIK